jgi:hypothetical protein
VLLTVKELQERVRHDLWSLVAELAELTGRGGDSERQAWQRSLPRFTEALSLAELAHVHVHFARREHHVAVEYQLPGVSACCDVVLIGRYRDVPSAVVVELKNWDTASDRPGVAEGLIERRGIQELHPSDQVRGYVEYCRHFHSAVLDHGAQVHGCVLFTAGVATHSYAIPPNDTLAANYPVFSTEREDISRTLPDFLRSRLTEADAEFATEFATGTFRQNRGFMQQIGRTILDSDIAHFELLDNQRRAFNLCLAKAQEAITQSDTAKVVIIIEGPPGSGKSAVAARLWASLVLDQRTPPGNVALVTTSQSQSSNWTYLVDRASRNRVGRGVALKATSFSPLDIPQLNRLRKAVGQSDLYKDAARWQAHLTDMARRGIAARPGAETDSCLVTLVDEAHALINPEREHGVGQYGFVTGLGPQAFHIIRCSRLAIFFLDPEQSFRVRENTTIADLENWAVGQGASVERVSLHGVQFRCAGSVEYVAWVESLLQGQSAELNQVFASAWRQNQSAPVDRSAAGNVIAFPTRTTSMLTGAVAAQAGGAYATSASATPRTGMDFRVFANPFEMEDALRGYSRSHTVRFVSTYSRPWKTEEAAFPHRLPPDALDFHEPVALPDGSRKSWSRPWNFVPNGDYTGFVSGRNGLPIHDDPLCEVGCTYAVRGFDFDYLGLLWLDDLVWRKGKWVAYLQNVHETGIGVLVKQARREGPVAPVGPRGANVIEKLRQAYRILLTRSIRGMFVWIADEETRNHVSQSMS